MPEYEVHQNVRIHAANAKEAIDKVKGTPIVLKAREITPPPADYVTKAGCWCIASAILWAIGWFFIVTQLIYPWPGNISPYSPEGNTLGNEREILWVTLLFIGVLSAITVWLLVVRHWHKSLK